MQSYKIINFAFINDHILSGILTKSYREMISNKKEKLAQHKQYDKSLFFKTKSQESDEENSPKADENQSINYQNADSLKMNKSRGKNRQILEAKEGTNWTILFISLTIFILSLFLIGLTIFIVKITKQQNGFSSLFNSFDREQILCVFVGLNGNQNTSSSLLSFLQKNNYPITTFVGIVKLIPDQKLIKKYGDFIWVVQGDDKYLYPTLDKILNQYKMKYFFYFDDQWEFVKPNFIIDSLSLLKQFSSTQQVLLYNPQNKPISSKNSKNLGFSFSPGLHRRSDFISVETQFSRISDEAQKTNSTVQHILSKKFMRKYLYALTTKQNYLSKIIQKGTNQNIYWKIRYDSFQNLNNQNEQQKKELKNKQKKQVKQFSQENAKEIPNFQNPFKNSNSNSGQIKNTTFKQGSIDDRKVKKNQRSEQIKEKKSITPSKRNKLSNFGGESQKYLQSLNKYSIKIGKFPDHKIGQIPSSYYGIDKNIQVGSSLDYLNISQTSQFKLMRLQWQNTLTYGVMNFKSDGRQRSQNQKYLKTNEALKNYQSIQLYLRKTLNQKLGLAQQYNVELGLAILLTLDPNNTELQQAQYLYLDHKYDIGNSSTQAPICIFSSAYNIASDNKYEEFFESIERQNYTNYKLIFVDDGSKDNSADILYNYLSQRNLNLKNKIQIVKNDFTIGSVGNLYLRIKQFCKQNDIVVSVDSKDKLVGHQVLKIINSVYQNPQVWYAYSRFISHVPNRKAWSFSSASSPVKINTSTYRTAVNQWSTSHLKTFRYSLFSKIPIQAFLQYHYNEESKQLQPRFYGGDAADRFIVYSMLELCGSDRIFHIQEGLYYQYPLKKKNKNCQNEHSYVDELKCRVKTPFKMLGSIEESPKALENYIIPEIILSTLARYFQNWERCIEIMESQNQGSP